MRDTKKSVCFNKEFVISEFVIKRIYLNNVYCLRKNK